MAQDTLLGFPAHTLPYRRGKSTALSIVSKGGIIVIIPPSACQKILFAPLRPFSELFKSSENAGF